MTTSELETLRWTDAVTLASPHPYVLVTTVDERRRPNIIGIGWFTITSWKPPMLCISVAPARHSYANLEKVPEFVVNFPTPAMARAAWTCGTTTGAEGDKFARTGLEPVASTRVAPPTIAGCLMSWECEVVESVETGDHRLFIARIVATRGAAGGCAHLYSIHYRRLVSVDHEAGLVSGVEHE